MAESRAFQWLCDALEQSTSLNRLEARGTVRLALKQSGLEPRSVSPRELEVVLDRLLPDELRSRGIDHAKSICSCLCEELSSLDLAAPVEEETPEMVFGRLGGS